MTDTIEELRHSSHGPSRADAYTTCLDYINANRGLADVTIEPAAEGTFAHAISDDCLMFGHDAHEFIGLHGEVEGFKFTWDEDDADLMQPGLDRFREIAAGNPIYGEHRVDISEWTLAGQFGTLDRATFTDTQIVVEDFKFGRIPVHPAGNKQLVLYALGFWKQVARHHTSATEFLLSIDQPRSAGGGGYWRTTLDELQHLGGWVAERVALTMQPNPPRTASLRSCLWCRRRRAPGGCDTFDDFMIALLGKKPEDLDATIFAGDPFMVERILDPERRGVLIEHKKMITQWLDQMEDDAIEDAQAGEPTGCVKAVLGNKGRDTWQDKETAEANVRAIVGERGITFKLKTPTQLRKEVSPEELVTLKPLIKVGEKKPILVPLADARAAIVPVAQYGDAPALPDTSNR